MLVLHTCSMCLSCIASFGPFFSCNITFELWASSHFISHALHGHGSLFIRVGCGASWNAGNLSLLHFWNRNPHGYKVQVWFPVHAGCYLVLLAPARIHCVFCADKWQQEWTSSGNGPHRCDPSLNVVWFVCEKHVAEEWFILNKVTCDFTVAKPKLFWHLSEMNVLNKQLLSYQWSPMAVTD